MHRKYQSYTADQWHQIMADFATSGLSQHAFCQQQGLAPSTFSKWRSQLGLNGSVKQRHSPSSASDFQALLLPDASRQPLFPVVADNTIDSSWQVELTLGAGMILRIRTAE